MGKVLVGMPGPWANDNREPADPYTTKIGGLPDWPLPKDYAINPDFLHCASCGSKLCLLAQLYAPLSILNQNFQERLLFIFGCITPKCGTPSHSWRVLRVQKVHDAEKEESQQTSLHDDEPSAAAAAAADDDDDASSGEVQNNSQVLEDLNDTGGSEGDVDFEELGKALFAVTTFASDTKTSKKKKPPKKRLQHKLPATPLDTDDSPVVPCFYIYTQEERTSKDLSSVCSSYSSLSIKENGSDVEDYSLTEETWENEQYEYDKALTADRIYLKFKKRLDAYPEQCFRYSYGGKPILAAAADIDPGRCSHCGRPRQFEMQLMSPLLYFLQEALDDDQRQMIENWEWMTLVVFTCSESCYRKVDQAKSDSNGWIVVEETVVAQYEESMPIQLGYFS